VSFFRVRVGMERNPIERTAVTRCCATDRTSPQSRAEPHLRRRHRGTYWELRRLECARRCLTSIRSRRRFHLHADFLSPRVYPLLTRAYIDTARRTTEPSAKRDPLQRAQRHAAAGMRSMKRRATYRAAALLAMAECRWEDGRETEARTLFDQSIAVADQQGSRMMLADAHYELGRRERDPDEARRHLQIALDLYDASDAAPYVRFARRALESLA